MPSVGYCLSLLISFVICGLIVLLSTAALQQNREGDITQAQRWFRRLGGKFDGRERILIIDPQHGLTNQEISIARGNFFFKFTFI